MALPKTGTRGQKYTEGGYTYIWTGTGWVIHPIGNPSTTSAATKTTISNTGITVGNTTSNSSISSNTIAITGTKLSPVTDPETGLTSNVSSNVSSTATADSLAIQSTRQPNTSTNATTGTTTTTNLKLTTSVSPNTISLDTTSSSTSSNTSGNVVSNTQTTGSLSSNGLSFTSSKKSETSNTGLQANTSETQSTSISANGITTTGGITANNIFINGVQLDTNNKATSLYGNTQPAGASAGDTWYNPDTNAFYVYDADGGFQLVSGIPGPTGPAGSAGGYTGSVGYNGSRGDLGYTGSIGAGGLPSFRQNFTASGSTDTFGPLSRVVTDPKNIIVSINGLIKLPTADYAIANPDANTAYLFFNFIPTAGQQIQVMFFDGGPQGPKGSTGPQGIQGIKGNTGLTGFAGSQGIQGVVGYVGSVGYQGSFGITGYVGSRSDVIGYTGSFGVTGFVGSQGVGFTGSQGVIGYTGSQGDLGYTGSFGTTGYVGSRGDTGYTGSQGDLGYTGSFGNIGLTGSRGVTGFVGSVGFVGSKGEKGDPTGYTGSGGIDGTNGYNGSAGYIGSFGYTGSLGNLGYTGSFGNIGFTGSQGIIGLTGYNGSDGYNGSVGYTGSFGYTGSQGIAGAYAALGYTGSFGYTGSYGYTGSIGFTGSVGYVGSQSNVIGFTGSFGNFGYSGSEGRGLRGFTGSLGDTGYTGSLSYTGSVGFVGSRGIPGTAGQSVQIVASVASSANLPAPAGYVNFEGIVTTDTGHLWVSNTTSWSDVGNVTGPQGAQGLQGIQGNPGQSITGYVGSRGFGGVPIGRTSYGYPDVDGTRNTFLLSPLPGGLQAAGAEALSDTAIIVYINGAVISPNGIQITDLDYSQSYAVIFSGNQWYIGFTDPPNEGSYVEVVYFGGSPTALIDITIANTNYVPGGANSAVTPKVGQLWIDADTGVEYLYVQDVANSTSNGFLGWVEFANEGTRGPTGYTGSVASGIIYNVTSKHKNDTFVLVANGTNAGQYGNVTGLNVNVTPLSISHRVFVTYDLQWQGNPGLAESYASVFRSMDNGATFEEIFHAAAVGSRPSASIGAFYADGNVLPHAGMHFLDSPGTTNTICYQIKVKNDGRGGDVYVNRTPNDVDGVYGARRVSAISAMVMT